MNSTDWFDTINSVIKGKRYTLAQILLSGAVHQNPVYRRLRHHSPKDPIPTEVEDHTQLIRERIAKIQSEIAQLNTLTVEELDQIAARQYQAELAVVFESRQEASQARKHLQELELQLIRLYDLAAESSIATSGEELHDLFSKILRSIRQEAELYPDWPSPTHLSGQDYREIKLAHLRDSLKNALYDLRRERSSIAYAQRHLTGLQQLLDLAKSRKKPKKNKLTGWLETYPGSEDDSAY